METQVKITPITIVSKGDESVGIFSAMWTISEEIYIESEDIEKFRKELKTAWEYVADDAEIIFASDNHPYYP